MIEILIVWQSCKQLRNGVLERGYDSAVWYQVMLVALWIGGEFVFAIIGALLFGNGVAIYVCALFGAAAGAIGAFLITHAATPSKRFGQTGYRSRTGGFPVLPPKRKY
jgi:hypothetical protein